MNTTPTYEAPQVVETLDELEVFGEAPASPTLVAGSGTEQHQIP